MKCEGFELFWNTLSLSKLKEITRSRFTWRVGTEKRSRTPFFYIISNITPFCASIAFRICSNFISSQLERTSFTNPPFVRRLGFRFWNFAFNPPFKFFHVWLTDWSNLLDSQDFLQGTLPHLPVLVRWTLQFQFGPLPFQLLAKLRCQISSTRPWHTQIESFRKESTYIWVELFVIVSENYFTASCLKFGSKFFFYNLCNCLGIHLFQFKTVFWLYWRARSFLSLPFTM